MAASFFLDCSGRMCGVTGMRYKYIASIFGIYSLVKVLWALSYYEGGEVADSVFWWVLIPLVYFSVSVIVHKVNKKAGNSKSEFIKSISLNVLIGITFQIVIQCFLVAVRMHLNYAPPPESESMGYIGVLEYVVIDMGFTFMLELYMFSHAAGLSKYLVERQIKEIEEKKEIKIKKERAEREKREAKLRSLKMQIKPHFLFNTLHFIGTMAVKKPKRVSKATKWLADILRYTTSSFGVKGAKVKDEIKFVSKYLDIQKLRLGEKFEYEVKVDNSIEDELIPAMMLQPIVENSVKYGIQKDTERGIIRIKARKEKPKLVFIIEDSGGELNNVDINGDGIGLEVTKKRLKKRYKGKCCVRVEKSELGGVGIKIKVPYSKSMV